MIFKKNTIFCAILGFSILVNCFLAFGLDLFYIRAILASIFILTIPGLLIMLMFKIRKVGFLEYLFYTFGLSIFFSMFAGLAVNWILPWLNVILPQLNMILPWLDITKPLSLWPVLICFDIFLLIFLAIAYKRNSDLTFEIKLPKTDNINRIFFVIPMIFPVLSVLGAFILNNNGPNYLTLIMLIGIPVYVFMITIFRDRLNKDVYPWALFMIGLALLLSFSMRSWYISSRDPNLEFMVSQLIKKISYWDISSLTNLSASNYQFMLSITILPNILFIFLRVNDYLIIRLFFQIVYALVPPILYIFFSKHFKEILSFLAAFFFIAQPMFFTSLLDISPRQELAFMFLGFMFLVLFNKEINLWIKNTLFIIFGFSMIVSHYSTAYIAIATFTLTYLCIVLYKIYERYKIKKGKLNSSKKQKFSLTWIMILLLVLFAYLWYFQITPTAEGLIEFTQRSISNIGDMFSKDVQSDQQSVFKLFDIFQEPENQVSMKDYAEKIIKNYQEKYPSPTFYGEEDYGDFSVEPKFSSSLNRGLDTSVVSTFSLLRRIFKLLGSILISIGFIFFLISQYLKKEKRLGIQYILLVSVGFFLLVFILIMPFISLNYDTGRIYQQMLMILSPMIVFFWPGFLSKEKKRAIIVCLFVILYFLFLSRTAQQFVGGRDIGLFLNNIGYEYDNVYTHQSEISSGEWFFKIYNQREAIHADNSAAQRIILSMKSGFLSRINGNIFPQIMRKEDYVYLSYTNFVNDISIRLSRVPLSYNYPDDFLNANKNLIYNNGGSAVFK